MHLFEFDPEASVALCNDICFLDASSCRLHFARDSLSYSFLLRTHLLQRRHLLLPAIVLRRLHSGNLLCEVVSGVVGLLSSGMQPEELVAVPDRFVAGRQLLCSCYKFRNVVEDEFSDGIKISYCCTVLGLDIVQYEITLLPYVLVVYVRVDVITPVTFIWAYCTFSFFVHG